MKIFLKALKTIGILVGVNAFWIALAYFSFRYTLLYVGVISSLLLPVLFWRNCWLWTSAFLATTIAIGCALSPLDFVFRQGELGVSILPTEYGISTTVGTVGYGCTASNPPSHAFVLSF